MNQFLAFLITISVCGPWALANPLAHPAGGGNSQCAQWCAANFPNPGKDCTSQAAKGKGPCYVCGPAKTSPAQQLCNGACLDTSMDNNNCGSCGNTCSSAQDCQDGTCKLKCLSGESICAEKCVNLDTDAENCGGCGTTCPTGQSCQAGTCTLTCQYPEFPCSGQCINIFNDASNCGFCGHVCDSGKACQFGSCACPFTTGSPGYCGGVCVNLWFDKQNCGNCGVTCQIACLFGTCFNIGG